MRVALKNAGVRRTAGLRPCGLAAAVAGLAVTVLGAVAASPEPGIVRVRVTSQEPNQFMPWLREAPREREGYGIRVGPSEVLTTEGLLRNQRAVEIQKARSGRKMPVTVKLTDPQVNLGILECAAGDAEGLGPVASVAATLPETDEFEILQFFDSGELQTVRASRVRIAMERLPDAPYTSLMLSLQTDSVINGQGAPVFNGGRLVGVVMNYDRSSRVATVAPAPILARFLEDAAHPPYRGFASAGFVRASLVDPVRRAYLGLPAGDRGVLVLSCLPGSPAGQVLRASDVILEWDGRPVDALGLYEDPEFGRLDFAYLVKGRRRPGDRVPVTVFRDGREVVVEVTLDCYRDDGSLIPEDVEGETPEYLVEGGLVFRELTGRYLRSHGNDWKRNADSRLVHLFLMHAHEIERPGDRIVVIAAVLPDPINIGYQTLRNQIVTAVNGETVRNLSDVFRVADRDGCLSRIRLKGIGMDIALDAVRLPEANARIAATYRLPQLRHRKQP